jgi:uncharacterized protein YjbI with pentapeptide repeats
MPWIDVEEPHARPPKLPAVKPAGTWSAASGDGWTAADGGWAELSSVELSGGPLPDLIDCDELTIADCLVGGVVLGPSAFDQSPNLAIEILVSTISDCDLSRARLQRIVRTRFVGCKFTGADLSAAVLSDVVFEGCAFSLTDLRMAKLKRVSFVDCVLDHVDGYRMEVQDVSVPGTTLSEVSLDGLQAERMDLREAAEVSLTIANSLSGCLLAEHQLAGLAHALAFAAGVDVERIPDEAD